ncbi:MAG: PAS domain S-box protein, partial [Rhizobacter sp.]|nr:PAS domain S-box protein [Burkholderiales bacterium]
MNAPASSTPSKPGGTSRGNTARYQLFALAAGAVIVTGVLLAIMLFYQRSQEIDAGKRLTESFAQVIEEQVTRTLQTIDLRLQLMSTGIEALQKSNELTAASARSLFQEDIRELPFVMAVQWVGVDGRIKYSSIDALIGADVSDHESFKHARDATHTGMYIDNPFRSRGKRQLIIAATRALPPVNGAFSGMIALTVDPMYFDKLWQTVGVGERGTVSLYRRDGTLLLRSPHDEAAMGKLFSQTRVFQNLLPQSPVGGIFAPSPIDGTHRYFAYRTLSAQPEFLVVVGKSTDAMLAPWWRVATIATLIWLVASSLLLTLCFFLGRAWRQRDEEEARSLDTDRRLALATDASAIGIWDWDLTADRWFFSHSYFTMLGYPPDAGEGNRQVWLDRLHPDDLATVMAVSQRAIEGHHSRYFYEARTLHADGSYRWISTIACVLERDETGRAVRAIGVRIDVTERKLAEESLRDSEARYRELFASNPHPMWVFDSETLAFLAVNDAAVGHYGFSRDEFLAMKISDIRPQDDVQQLQDYLALPEPRSRRDRPWRHRRKDGSEILVEITCRALMFGDRPAELVLSNDVTAREEAIQQLRLSEENLSITLQSIGDAVIATDAEGRITRMNATAERLTGWPLATAAGNYLSDILWIVDSETRIPKPSPVDLALQRGEVVHFDTHTTLLSRDDHEYQVSDSAAPIRDASNNIVGAVLVFSDVTEQDRVRRALATSAAMLERTGEIAKVGGWELNLQTNTIYCTRQMYRIHEISSAHLLTLDQWLDAYPLDAQVTLRAAIDLAITYGTAYELELQIVTAKDNTIWVRIQGYADQENGKTVKLHGAIQDITERRRADDEVRKLSLALEQSTDAIMITNLKSRIEYVNAAFVELTGYARADVIGRNPRALLAGSTVDARFKTLWSTVKRGEVWRGHFVHRRKDGSERDEALVVSPLRGLDGKIRHFVTAMEDVTEKRRLSVELDKHRHHLEDLVATRTVELRAAQRQAEAANAAKSTFLANMSHEIRTPLNAIIGLSYLLRRAGPTPEQADRLGKIDTAGRHLLSIINDVLDLSKIEAGRLQLENNDFHLASVLEYVASMMAETARSKGLQIVVMDHSAPVWLRGDVTRLRQALLNYAENAVKFTESGRIELSAKLLEQSGNELLVRFLVVDTGVGIAAEQLTQLFEAFEQADASTTRKHGGTGLGLTITRRLAELMGGEVGAESEVGLGSRFWFTARLQHGKSVMPAPIGTGMSDVETQIRAMYPGARILLVEDNPINREVVIETLRGV